jgi:hypothetical protein
MKNPYSKPKKVGRPKIWKPTFETYFIVGCICGSLFWFAVTLIVVIVILFV